MLGCIIRTALIILFTALAVVCLAGLLGMV